METISVIEAAKIMHKDPSYIRIGLQQGTLPFGSAIQVADHKYSYHISPNRFAEYMGISLEKLEVYKMKDIFSKLNFETNAKKITHELSESRKAVRPNDTPACAVNDISVIAELMKENKENTLQLVQLLNSTITDQNSLMTAINIVTNYQNAGIISGNLVEHIKLELSTVLDPDAAKNNEDPHAYQTIETIENYIDGNYRWQMREVILWHAFELEQLRNLKNVEYVIDCHVSQGNMPQNIATLTKMYYENIYNCHANDFHDFAEAEFPDTYGGASER